MTTLLTRFQLGGIAALLLTCGILIGAGALWSPRVPFVFPDGPGVWIMASRPIRTSAIAIDPANPPVTIFVRRFAVDAPPGTATIALRAMREVALFVNEQPVDMGSPGNWKQVSRSNVAGLLHPGENVVRAEVRNPSGPALLQLRLEAPGLDLDTDERWTASSEGGPAAAAVRADDTRLNPDRVALPAPLRELAAKGAIVLFLFAAGAAAGFITDRGRGSGAAARAPTRVALALSAFWVVLYLAKLPQIPLHGGFDGIAHLEYVSFIRVRGTLPLATDGWSMYQPPLFYVLTAGLLGLFDPTPGGVGERLVFRLVPFLAGLGNVWIARAVGQRFFPNDPVRVAFAVGFAGLVPMNVYMSAYVSNEPLHGFFASLALLAASLLLLRPGGSMGWAAAAGACLGLALLTKFTSILLVPCICFFVAVKLLLIDRAGFVRALCQAMMVAAVAFVLAGWFYVRNWIHFGDPFVWNVDLPGHTSYWQQPGFHTPAYYLQFGEVLAHPWYAGFASFWDGLYATLWGDGFVGGCAYLRDRHPAWNYAFVSIGYLLALPATLLATVGFVRSVASALRGEDLPARALRAFHTTVAFGIGFSVLYMTLRLPFWGQTKAFYGLCALIPLSLVAGEGLGWLRDVLAAPRWQWLRLLFWGWLAALSGVLVLSFLG